MAKMLARDAGSKFGCGCCGEYATNSKGRRQEVRTNRRREKQTWKKQVARSE
jgi:hypothetical protein